MITIHILIQNNLNQIETTLESLQSLDCEFIFGDLGSTDGTADICKKYGKVISVQEPRHTARNKLLSISKTEWQFYIEPGETLSSGHDLFYFLEGLPKRVYVVADGVITKEVRIWKECQFVNPVFEYLQTDEAETINIFLAGAGQPNQLEKLLAWKKQSPQSADVDYYLACQYLVLKDYNRFSTYAESFLFKECNPTYPAIMTRYYLAQVQLHVKKHVHEATRNIVYCLAQKPLMAEFWCVVGDCFYRAGVPEKAIEFFRMAIEMGKSRPTDDPYPIEVAKYNEYPAKMIELCKAIVKTTFPYH